MEAVNHTYYSWLLHWQAMMTSSNGNIFRVIGLLCGEFTGHRWITRTKASDAEFWCFFDLRLNKRLSKQSWGWWFETLSRPLWRHCNALRQAWGISVNLTDMKPNQNIASHISCLYLLELTLCFTLSNTQTISNCNSKCWRSKDAQLKKQ